MARTIDNRNFRDSLISGELLDDAIDWISENLDPAEVFSEEQLISWVKDWAGNNGYLFKPEEDE